jgi:deoxyribodipyrimidine photolyase
LGIHRAHDEPRSIIVWFRDDLRLSDHPALHAAAKAGAPVICLYVLEGRERALKAYASIRND